MTEHVNHIGFLKNMKKNMIKIVDKNKIKIKKFIRETLTSRKIVNASTPGHPHLPRQFIPYFLARKLARKYEKMSPQVRLPLRLRHSISQFGR